MEIIRLCPFSVATIPWGEHPTGQRVTIAVKGTFILTHRAEATLAPQQDTVHGDISWDHNPQASLFAPSDFVPFKPRIDVVFSGRAFAPGGAPTESLTPRLQVGHLRKSLRVVGPRVWMDGSGGLSPSVPERFTTAPLRYELAAMKGENLSGIQLVGSTGWPLPRIETLDEGSAKPTTPGFGPLPIRWRAERHALSEAGQTFVRRLRAQYAVTPEDFPFSVFNCAPSEQQLDELEPAPSIILEHLCRKVPRLETRLPMIRPRAFFKEEGSSTTNEVDLRLDTIFIDGVRMVAVVTWRGWVPVPDAEKHHLGRVVVAAESPEMTVSPEDVENPEFFYEEHSIRPMLPRPFEGEAPDDEGYTLLPTKPARQGGTDLPPSPARAPHPRDSSIPASGERPIEARVIVGVLPGPNEIVERASLGQFSEAPLTIPQAAQFSSAPGVWETQPDWRRAAAAASGPPTPRNDGVARAEDAAPATARTGAGAVPPTQPPGGPDTQAPGTPKAGTLPPPATLPTHLVAAPKSPDVAPSTERTPQQAPVSAADSNAIVVSAVGSAKPTSMKIEAVKPSAGGKTSSSSMSMMPMPIADIPIDVCAMVAARVERRPGEQHDILQEMGLSVSMFNSAERTWAAAIRTETEQGRSDLRALYDRCYVGQLEMERGPLDVLDYVRLMIGVEHGDLDEVLAEFDVPQSSLVRIERVWQERMSTEPSLGSRVRQAMASARRAFTRSQRIPSLSESKS